MNVIAWLRTPVATLIVLCSALLAQLPHAADVFRLIVLGDGIWATLHSYTYAVALELAVLLFVVQRRNVESYLFAAVSILVNLSYYYLHGVALFTPAALPAWLVSIALPAAIAQYSHLIAAATAQTATPATQPRAWNWRFWRKAATRVVAPAQTRADAPQPTQSLSNHGRDSAATACANHSTGNGAHPVSAAGCFVEEQRNERNTWQATRRCKTQQRQNTATSVPAQSSSCARRWQR